MANQQVYLYSQEGHLEMTPKIAIAIIFGGISLMCMSLLIGMQLGKIQVGMDCLQLGAFEVKGHFYECDLKVVDYVESEDFK
ncbi:hypothetical protein D3C71_1265830 [compost metagenome]